jgi:fibronectin-binding autotransporter adhesin
MALRTVSNAGGGWNSTLAWVGGVVPIAGDTVDFTATSGPLIVNISTATLIGIDFTNYVNTITFNQPINTNGTVNLGTGGYTQDGTNGLIINGSTTISGTTTWSRTISFTGTTYVITLSNTLNITGQVTFSQAGTLSFSVGVNTFNPTGNILVAHGTTTLPNNLNIVNLSAIPSTTTQPTLNGNSINISGNLTLNSSVSGMFLGGTTNLVLNGSGSQTWSHSGTAMQLRNNLTISASGTITISGIVYYNTGILTYTGGTVTTTSSTLNIGTSTTLNTSGILWNNITVTATSTLTLTSNLAWSGTFSITAGNTTFAGVGTMSGAALSITTIGGTVILNNDITCTGLVTLGVGGGTGCTLNSSGGTRTIITSGGIKNATTSSFITCNINIKVTGGTITSSGNPLIGGYYQVNTGYQFEIDGNVTFASTGAFYIYGGVNTGTGGTLKHTSGTVTTTGSSVIIHSMFVNSGTITWNNMWILSGAPTITVLQSNMTVNGLLTLGYLIVGYTINNDGTARTITANGGITMSGSTSVVLGTANIRATGGTITGIGTVQLRNNLELAGNITFASGVTFSYNTGTLLYTSGTITTTNSTLAISASTTLNTSGVPWVNIIINGTSTITLSSNLAWSGTFSITAGNTTFSGVGIMSGAALTITNSNGTVTLNNDITCTGLVTLGVASTGTTLNSSGGTRTIITSGGLTNATTTSFIVFNINIRVTGGTITSSGSTSGGYYQINTGYQFEIAGNVAFSASTFYIYGGVSTGTGGTFRYTSGVVTTTGSFIWVQALNFNPGSIQWNNVWFISGSSSTTVLQSDVTVNGY